MMSLESELPDGLVLARTTPTYDQDSVPPGLLKAHQVATGVWGRLSVKDGVLDFAFDEFPDEVRSIRAGQHVVIPPARPHHVTAHSPVSFFVEFYRQSSEDGQV